MDRETAGRHRLRNLLHTLLLIGGMALILALCSELLLGDGVWPWVFAGVVLAMLALPEGGGLWLLRAYRARPLGLREAPGLHALLGELARRAGLEREPELFWVPSSTLNAFTVGSRNAAAVAVTDGLLQRLSPRELAGVLAHEVSHVAHNDMRLMGLADLVSRLTHVLSLLGAVLVFVSLPLLLAGLASISLLALLLLLAAPVLSALLQLGLSRVREFDADLEAARLTGDPEGLASALAKLEQFQGSWWQRLLYPRYRDSQPSLLRTHPDSRERIERLLELGQRPIEVLPPLRPQERVDLHLPAGYRVVRSPRHRIVFGVWH